MPSSSGSENSPFIFESGDPGGRALLFFHGFPGSHRQGAFLEPVAHKYNLRILAPDRPGYGFSTPLPGAGLREFMEQLERALDRLRVEKFYLLGVSGGNPAAVCAAGYFGSRVLGLGSLCGIAPYPEARDLFFKYARTGFDLARKTPEFLMRLTINQFLKGIKPEARLEAMIEKLSPADRDILSTPEIREVMFESMALARRQGGAGIIFDIKACSNPWPVDLSLLRCPYTLWHGLEDRVLPYTLSEFMHAKVPHSRLKLFPGEGHYSLPFKYIDEILTDLTKNAGKK